MIFLFSLIIIFGLYYWIFHYIKNNIDKLEPLSGLQSEFEDKTYDIQLESNKEYILCSAIKRLKPIEVKSYNYQTSSQKMDDIYSIEIGRRHNDIFSRFGKVQLNVKEQGFYTSFGRFVTREEALLIAKKAGQIKDVADKTRLFSEDLY